MWHFQVVKNSYCLGLFAFLIYRQLTLNFFSWPSLAKSENVFQPLSKACHIEHNKENKLPCVIHVSVCLTKRFHDSVRLLCNTVDPRCRQMIVKTKQWHTSRGCVTHIFFSHAGYDVFCDLLLTRPTATRNLFVLYDEKKGKKQRAKFAPLDC